MKKAIRYILLTVCVCVFCYSAYNLINIYLNYKKIDDDYGELAKTYTEEKEEKESYLQINWDELLQRNKDVKAWIQIPNTNVNYPVLQGETNDTYIHSDIDHNELSAGSIFIASENEDPFNDFNTVIYGHNMRDETMFGGLKSYMDESYMKAHSQILIYTPEHILTYQVFAAVTYDNRHILNSFDFESEEGFQEYLDSLKEVRNMSSYIDSDVEVTTEDKIITLSTCNGNSDQRFLVEAVLVNEE